MLTKSRLSVGAVALSLILLPISAFAKTPVGPGALSEWNLIVLGDLNSNSEVEGRTFVGGNLSGNSSNYNTKSSDASANAQPGLTVVGNVTGGHKNLNNASGAVIGGNVESGFNLNGAPQTVQVGGSIANTNVNQNKVISGLAASNPAFAQDLQQTGSLVKSSMLDLSHDLAAQPSTSALVIKGNRGIFSAQPDASGNAVFNITSDNLNAIGEIQFDLNGADTVIVNVSGANIVLNDNFLGGTKNLGKNVIWNFPDAKTLDLSTAWGGSVLAPSADAKTGNYIQGSAVFGNLLQQGAMQNGTYAGSYWPPQTGSSGGGIGGSSGSSGDAISVPEPGMLVLMALALGALLFARRKRKAIAA
ncbi:choice-of-anchor A family protein [Blastomonas sp.]|uniref:choice-of-anchor A family protein n=1 Tax=Blastomonas sp. TaxID=1909299 RepID=UPI002610F7C1|nr:choice-of-anchor A family protein [Blastomonas sp.]MDM7957900.1 choice-of-anchor A family protein [Blastomonas sp.]